MTARGRTLGAITFANSEAFRRFDEEDLALAEELGRRAGVATDNARLHGELQYIARTLQESLLPPHLPELPGVEAAARFHAAGEGNEVGGDFYDLFEAGDSWAIVIGDVCGKGADAAAVTALARYTLRATAMREREPSEALRVLNEAMLRQRSDTRFCSVAYASLQNGPGPPLVTLAVGGHPLPLIVHADGRVEPAGSPGTLLGVVADPDVRDHRVTLAPGDALVLYTDGVSEVRSGEEEVFGQSELSELLSRCAGKGADAIASTLEGAVLEAQHGEPRDDIAILVLRVPE
jgi:serine phosphatase RsbU (regulator of sigma subunit)